MIITLTLLYNLSLTVSRISPSLKKYDEVIKLSLSSYNAVIVVVTGYYLKVGVKVERGKTFA